MRGVPARGAPAVERVGERGITGNRHGDADRRARVEPPPGKNRRHSVAQ